MFGNYMENILISSHRDNGFKVVGEIKEDIYCGDKGDIVEIFYPPVETFVEDLEYLWLCVNQKDTVVYYTNSQITNVENKSTNGASLYHYYKVFFS